MTDSDLTLYAWQGASRAERCLWALHEAGIEHQLVRLAPDPTSEAYIAFRALNPTGKIPTLVAGDEVMTESMPICEHIARQAPDKRLLPESAAEHYAYGRVTHYMITEIEAYLWVGFQSAQLKEMYPWPSGTAPFSFKLAQKHLDGLRHLVGETYTCCGRFTVADILLTQLANWAQSCALSVPDAVAAIAERSMQRETCPEAFRGTA